MFGLFIAGLLLGIVIGTIVTAGLIMLCQTKGA